MLHANDKFLAGFLGDLYSFNISTERWRYLSPMTKGDSPPPSKGHTLAAVGKSLYLFGGYIESGLLISDTGLQVL